MKLQNMIESYLITNNTSLHEKSSAPHVTDAACWRSWPNGTLLPLCAANMACVHTILWLACKRGTRRLSIMMRTKAHLVSLFGKHLGEPTGGCQVGALEGALMRQGCVLQSRKAYPLS